MIQLLRGVKHLHDNWILHRDLKTSNLLLSHAGILKVGPQCPGALAPPLPSFPLPAAHNRPVPILAGGRLWAGARIRVPSEGLHPGRRDPVVPRPRAAARCQGECRAVGACPVLGRANPLNVSPVPRSTPPLWTCGPWAASLGSF